jgi:multisubunit Na+/H+ antiporter MnhB subunit
VSLEASDILGAIAIGIGATLAMDLWNLFLKRAFRIPSLNYCLLGRWFRHMPSGIFRHASIAAAPQKSLECTVGRIAHYTIGVVLALVFVVLASPDWLARPTVLPALLFGIGTVVFPLFIMQPSLGLGIAASRTPNPTQARVKSLVTHIVFGVGLYVCALGVSYLLQVHA